MLSEEEKSHIQLEEIFRHEVQQQIQTDTSKRSKRDKLVSIINSAFFLWFLSTILIGTGAFFYNRSEKQRENERRQYELDQTQIRERQLIERKLDAEISSRLNYFNVLYVCAPHKALIILDRPLEADHPVNLFPEYGNRSLQSLLWELLQLVSFGDKEEIQMAYRSAKDLPLLYFAWSRAQSKLPSSKNFHRLKNSAVVFSSEDGLSINVNWFNLDRWGKPLTFL